MILPHLARMLAFGGDYNPEQWSESVWLEDMKLMREAGVNLVTVGVFSWSRLQSSENRYDFGWLDRVMDLLAKNGIGADLATGTASPPPWLSHRHPDVLAIDASGLAYHVGSRQHYSPCSPTYRRFARRLVEKLARRYAQHPALKAWHVNNEFLCHLRECHSPASAAAFRAWLRKRYGSLAALNAAWTTSFWSQHYQSWNEVSTPRRVPYTVNPTQQLDFQRFMSDAARDLHRMEREILRRITPDVPVTTNFMGFFKGVDQFSWADDLEFASWDSYPDPTNLADGAHAGAAGHDLTRSVKKGRPFVLMEQATAAVNWRPLNAPKPPGVMRLWSLQAVARGADGVLFFQWRASRGGGEKYHSAMVPHVAPETNRVFSEVKSLGAELRRLAPVVGSVVRPRVAIAFDWNAWWAVEREGGPVRFDYVNWVQRIHRHFYARNIAVDFVAPSEPLAAYSLVVAPALYLLTKSDAANLTRFTAGGGTLLATYFSAIVDENEQVVLGGYAGFLREALGLWVEEWYPLPESTPVTARFGARGSSECTHWCDAIRLEGARVLGAYTSGPLRGQPALTRHPHGKGIACYLGTRPDERTLGALLDDLCRQAKVAPVCRTPAGVEATLRETPQQQFLFLLNHRETPARIVLPRGDGRELLGGRPAGKALRLPPRGAAVIAYDVA